MIYQIAGIVLVSVSLICFTWWKVTNAQRQTNEQNHQRKLREARNARVFDNEAMMLYEDERQRRIEAEQGERLAKERLRRSQNEVERLKKLLKEAEQ